MNPGRTWMEAEDLVSGLNGRVGKLLRQLLQEARDNALTTEHWEALNRRKVVRCTKWFFLSTPKPPEGRPPSAPA